MGKNKLSKVGSIDQSVVQFPLGKDISGLNKGYNETEKSLSSIERGEVDDVGLLHSIEKFDESAAEDLAAEDCLVSKLELENARLRAKLEEVGGGLRAVNIKYIKARGEIAEMRGRLRSIDSYSDAVASIMFGRAKKGFKD